MTTILAAIDFSEASTAVSAAALSLAKATGGQVVLLAVVQPPIITSEYATTLLTNYDAITAEAEKAAARRLESLRQRFQTAKVPAEVVQRNGAPAAQILAEARASKADYIVVGSHGHTALFDLLVGSTTHGVLRRSPCPVVIVPAGPKRARRRRG